MLFKIGDKYVEWDDEDRRWQEYGNYDNLEYVYVEATDALAEGKLAPDISLVFMDHLDLSLIVKCHHFNTLVTWSKLCWSRR